MSGLQLAHKGRVIPITYDQFAPLMAALMGSAEVTKTPTGYTHTWSFTPPPFVPFNEQMTYTPQRNEIVARNVEKVLDAIYAQMRDNATRDVTIGEHRVRFEKRQGRTFVKALTA